ncbi:MAG: phosphatidate cytidylyltransferase [Geminicoccaceae bacterium]
MVLRPGRAFDPAFRQRAVSSLVMAIGALGAVIVGGWPFVALVLAAILVMADEWSRLAATAEPHRFGLTLLTGALPCLAVVAMTAGAPALALAAMIIAPLAGAGVALSVPGWPAGRVAAGTIYVGVPGLALVWLRSHAPGGSAHLLWLLLVVCATDICAYLVGRTIGGPKLAPRISPGKTWSGLCGGVAGASLTGGIAAMALGAGYGLAAAVGALLALVGQGGDLFESALKRRAGVKDSGYLIPGHGGLLDRIDGLAFAAPVFAGLVWLSLRAGSAP